MLGHPLTDLHLIQLAGALFGVPRELAGGSVRAIEGVLEAFEDGRSATYVEHWYRGAEPAQYSSEAAAAAYLGAYGARSYLKYQEATVGLLNLLGEVPSEVRVLDYGCGPGIGFAALVDLWGNLAEVLGVRLSLRYHGLEPAAAMRNVAAALAAKTPRHGALDLDFAVSEPTGSALEADVLVVSNVMNEGEGIDDPAAFLAPVVARITNLQHIIVIEPATETVARQMCALANSIGGFSHIGPCPSGGSGCREWTFREFTKRTYRFEYRCLGRWSPAARTCKYALALLSCTGPIRNGGERGRVVVSTPLRGDLVRTCALGEKVMQRCRSGAGPWDLVDANGNLLRSWP